MSGVASLPVLSTVPANAAALAPVNAGAVVALAEADGLQTLEQAVDAVALSPEATRQVTLDASEASIKQLGALLNECAEIDALAVNPAPRLLGELASEIGTAAQTLGTRLEALPPPPLPLAAPLAEEPVAEQPEPSTPLLARLPAPLATAANAVGTALSATTASLARLSAPLPWSTARTQPAPDAQDAELPTSAAPTEAPEPTAAQAVATPRAAAPEENDAPATQADPRPAAPRDATAPALGNVQPREAALPQAPTQPQMPVPDRPAVMPEVPRSPAAPEAPLRNPAATAVPQPTPAKPAAQKPTPAAPAPARPPQAGERGSPSAPADAPAAPLRPQPALRDPAMPEPEEEDAAFLLPSADEEIPDGAGAEEEEEPDPAQLLRTRAGETLRGAAETLAGMQRRLESMPPRPAHASAAPQARPPQSRPGAAEPREDDLAWCEAQIAAALGQVSRATCKVEAEPPRTTGLESAIEALQRYALFRALTRAARSPRLPLVAFLPTVLALAWMLDHLELGPLRLGAGLALLLAGLAAAWRLYRRATARRLRLELLR
jgi:hypothetical protein